MWTGKDITTILTLFEKMKLLKIPARNRKQVIERARDGQRKGERKSKREEITDLEKQWKLEKKKLKSKILWISLIDGTQQKKELVKWKVDQKLYRMKSERNDEKYRAENNKQFSMN